MASNSSAGFSGSHRSSRARRKNIFTNSWFFCLPSWLLGCRTSAPVARSFRRRPCQVSCSAERRSVLTSFRYTTPRTLRKGGERLQYSGDLLDRQLRAFLLRIKCSARFSKVILDRLLHRLERVGIELPMLTGKELNGPLID